MRGFESFSLYLVCIFKKEEGGGGGKQGHEGLEKGQKAMKVRAEQREGEEHTTGDLSSMRAPEQRLLHGLGARRIAAQGNGAWEAAGHLE